MITNNYETVGPAYGRDYKSARDARAAFLSGVDFKLYSVTHEDAYCSVRDFAPGTTVNVRYKQMERIVPVVVPTDAPRGNGGFDKPLSASEPVKLTGNMIAVPIDPDENV